MIQEAPICYMFKKWNGRICEPVYVSPISPNPQMTRFNLPERASRCGVDVMTDDFCIVLPSWFTVDIAVYTEESWLKNFKGHGCPDP